MTGELGASAAAFVARVDALAAGDRFSGSVLVWRAGGPVFEHWAGLAHRGHRVAVGQGSRFAVGSVTKMVTAATVLGLVRQARFGLDGRLVDLLPPHLLPSRTAADLTVHHLLSQTSGLANYHDDDAEDWGSYTSCWDRIATYHARRPVDLLPLYRDLPAVFAPGQRFGYADANYIQLGVLVEHVTGRPFGEVARETVLEPAGMAHTGFVQLDQDPPALAMGYRPVGDPPVLTSSIYSVPAASMTDGGMITTPADVARLIDAIADRSLLGEQLSAAMLTRHDAQSPTGYAYGYGTEQRWRNGQLVRWGHDGLDPGVSAVAAHYPDTGTTLVVLSNLDLAAGPVADLATTAFGLNP